jgi:putative lipoprotein
LPKSQLKGTVTYRQRVALTRDAALELRLVDSSQADTSSLLIAEQTIEAPGHVPIAFDLAYDPAKIEANRRYTLQARITERGVLRFVNDVSAPVLTRGAPSEVEIVLRMVSGEEVDDSEAPLGSR